MFHLRSNNLRSLIQKTKAINGSESGQAIILVSVVVLSFLLFFGFAINIGLLVNAKISLQNAADAAAYAGAATQARQLNAISYLNYDMRRQYKKFLFRYNFVGSIGSPGFPAPAQPNGSGDYDFPKNDYTLPRKPNLKPGTVSLKVPVVCIPLTTNGRANDNCLQVNLPNTSSQVMQAFPMGGLTQITKALLEQINQVQAFQANICTGQGQVNLFVLINWLFRGDVDPATLTSGMLTLLHPGGGTLTDDENKAIETVKALVQGLGLYPRNILNLMRIETLEGFLNQPPLSDVDQDKIKSLESAQDADANERTIQAFKSALANLNAQVMSPTDLTMTELENPQQLKTEAINTDFNAYVQMTAPGASQTTNGPTFCNSAILPFPAKVAPVGVKRLSSPALTHYAVKLKAKVKLLFLPIRDGLELEAVSAAKPFGSRIGPQTIESKDFTSFRDPPVVNGTDVNDCTGPIGCQSPNLNMAGTNSFFTATFLKALMDSATNGAATFDFDGIMRAQRHAIAPNPAEVGKYNILPQAKSANEMAFEFIPYSDKVEADPKNPAIYRFYAPLFPAGTNNTSDRVDKLLKTMFATTNVGQNALGIDEQQMRTSLLTTINAYISKLNSSNATENNETTTFAAIELPMRNSQTMTKNKNFWLTEANEVLSSWGPKFARVDAGNPRFQPRFGYSVKFVTMQNLLSAGMADTDGDLEKVSH
jgi:hypothetical protein